MNEVDFVAAQAKFLTRMDEMDCLWSLETPQPITKYIIKSIQVES
ncbi:hypothetical protein [Polynucleobacter sp.]|nr:hypothetical protein [Polynucleobacter sp.]